MDPRISIVTLGVADLAVSTAFYRDGLGWPYLADKSGEGISFFEVNHGTLWLALYPRPLLAEDAQVPDGPAGFSGFTLAQLARDRDEVNLLMDKALAAGAKITKAPQQVFWGGYSGYFADPDGFLWEVAFNPYSWFE
ncbi:VOC family protein [Niveibacterium terrae]|uniref:VOC family protein n=1 Tax=Niveibacterium terrae TaxID=3373598 RepID=UPI003A932A43